MNKPLTQKPKIRYVKFIAGNTRQSGLTARFTGGHTAAFMAVFFVRSMVPSIWAAMREAFGPAGPCDRSVNPHGRPFCLTAERAGKTTFTGGIMMSKNLSAADDIRNPHDPLSSIFTPLSKLKLKDRDSNETRHPTASFFLSEISSHDAKTLLEFMQLHLPGCKQLNPDMTWEESHEIGKLFEKVRAVLYCLARGNQDQEVNL